MTWVIVGVAVVAVWVVGTRLYLANSRSTGWLDRLRKTDPEQAARLEAARVEHQLRGQSGGGMMGRGL